VSASASGPLLQLRTLADLDAVLAESALRPVVLFKYSDACGTSAQALDELTEYLVDGRRDVCYAMVTVQTERAISNAIAERLRVRHETPQVLLVRHGRAEWSASHYRVTAASLARALEPLPAPPPTPTTTPTGS
jgi:bacillithiol system protein YtxJ